MGRRVLVGRTGWRYTQTSHPPRVLQELQSRVLPPLGASILKPHLHPSLAEADPERHLLAEEDVRVVRLLEQRLQLLQLLGRKGRPVATLAPPTEHVLGQQVVGQRRQVRSSHGKIAE